MHDINAEVIELLGSMVAIPSVNPAFRGPNDPETYFGELRMAEHVADWLDRANIEVELQEVLPGRPNVVARVKGRGACRSLLWEGHLDTVQVTGMTVEPFQPLVRDGRLYGRGAVDDGGCLTAMMLALRELQRNPTDVDVTFLAAVDEEHQFRGVLHHLANNGFTDAGIAGEPTGLRAVSACKGCVRWRIEVIGRAAHTSQPHFGIDAIAIGAELLSHLRATVGRSLAARTHTLVGSPTLTCSIFEGGHGVNTVAERCVLTFDRRTLPDETGLQVWRQAEGEVSQFAATVPEARIVMHAPFIDSISMEVEPDAAIIDTARHVCRVEGLPDAIEGVAYGSDASKMTRAGIPTIIFGPGEIGQAHTADEYVAVAEVVRASRMLEAMARRFGDADR